MGAYVIDWEKAGESVVDLSGFLDRRRGRMGFVRVEGERLVTGDGKRLRMLGVNATGGVCFAEKEAAVLLAEDFARLGFNCVRFHQMDEGTGSGRWRLGVRWRFGMWWILIGDLLGVPAKHAN